MPLRFQPLALLAIGLVYGGGIGFTLAAANNVALTGHDHGPAGHAHAASADVHDHHHGATVDVGGPNAPTLSARLHRDPVSGWNLHIETENFRFAPENAGRGDRPGEGHAHVYVDGEKIARLYGPWMHIASLPEDANVEVTLNSNDHAALSVADKPLRAHARISDASESAAAKPDHHSMKDH